MKNRRLKNVSHELRSDGQAIFACIYFAGLLVLILIPCFTKTDPNAIHMEDVFLKPCTAHWFGTDALGRDYFTRVANGGRISLLIGILAMLTSMLIGVTVGAVSGYFGGVIDSVLMRIVDVISSIPWMILVTVASLFLKRGLFSIIFVIGFFTWMGTARLVRSETMSCREREYVQYAAYINKPFYEVIFCHVIPTVFPVIVTTATGTISDAILIESSLSFLGIGIQQPLASWGSLLNDAQSCFEQAPYMGMIPGVLIVLTIYSFNKLGDVCRAYVEPKITEGDNQR